MTRTDTASDEVLLTADAVSRNFGLRRALEEVSLEAKSGEILVVAGPNGSGKSTLLKILAGLMRPSGGRVGLTADGGMVQPEKYRFHVALAAPGIEPYLHLTLSENIRFVNNARMSHISDSRITEIAVKVGLEARKDDCLTEYSSGMLQRARLAIALSVSPVALLLDEPTQYLDESGRCCVAEIANSQRQRGVCVIATNDDYDISLADRVVTLSLPE